MYALASDQNSTNCSLTNVTKKSDKQSIANIELYTIRISDVTANLTGTTVTCLLLQTIGEINENIQWKREAYLTVIKEDSSHTSISISLIVTLVLVLVVSLLAIGVTVVIKKKRKKIRANVNLDEGL